MRQLSELIYHYARYLFDKGDVMNNGETIQGILPDSRWKCHHETALVAPKRIVLDINPGKLYAAGERSY